MGKISGNFPEISGKIGINFREFPEISELTTLDALSFTAQAEDAAHIRRKP